MPSPFDHFRFALIHGPNLPGSYAILLFTASDLSSVTSHIQNWVLFLLWFHPFILSGVISPLISSSILGTYRPGEFLFQYPVILPFHTVYVVLKARILKWFAIPFSSGPHSVRPVQHHPSVLGGPTRHGLVSLSYTRLWSLWSDWLVVCDCGFSLSALWYPLSVPTILLAFLLPWSWGISSRLLQQSTAVTRYFGWEVSPQGRPSWPWTWSSSSQPSCTHASLCLWTWGSSSQPPPLTSDVGSSSRLHFCMVRRSQCASLHPLNCHISSHSPALCYKDCCDYIGPTWIIRIIFLSQSLKF